jgi:hypothetical protein
MIYLTFIFTLPLNVELALNLQVIPLDLDQMYENAMFMEFILVAS